MVGSRVSGLVARTRGVGAASQRVVDHDRGVQLPVPRQVRHSDDPAHQQSLADRHSSTSDERPPSRTPHARRSSGMARSGQRLTAARGSWSMTGLDFSYQWIADGVPVEGATRKALRLAADQRGAKIQVRVSATKPGQRRSYGILGCRLPRRRPRTLHRQHAPPTISGIAQVGQTLTATKGHLVARRDLHVPMVRPRTCIPGATLATFTPIGRPDRQGIRVKVVATRDGYKRAVEHVDLRRPRSCRGRSSTASRRRSRASPRSASSSRAIPGTWSPTGRYTYQWFADGVALAKATSATFTPRGGSARLGI